MEAQALIDPAVAAVVALLLETRADQRVLSPAEFDALTAHFRDRWHLAQAGASLTPEAARDIVTSLAPTERVGVMRRVRQGNVRRRPPGAREARIMSRGSHGCSVSNESGAAVPAGGIPRLPLARSRAQPTDCRELSPRPDPDGAVRRAQEREVSVAGHANFSSRFHLRPQGSRPGARHHPAAGLGDSYLLPVSPGRRRGGGRPQRPAGDAAPVAHASRCALAQGSRGDARVAGRGGAARPGAIVRCSSSPTVRAFAPASSPEFR